MASTTWIKPDLISSDEEGEEVAQETPRDSAYGTLAFPSIEPSASSGSGGDDKPVQKSLRKRLREDDDDGDEDDEEYEAEVFADNGIDDDDGNEYEDDREDGDVSLEDSIKGRPALMVGVVLPSFNVPRSQYDGYKHKLRVEKEFQVVLQLLDQESDVDSIASPSDFWSYRLENFTAYYPDSRRLRCEMAALSNLAIKAGESAMLFDGILTDGKTRHYVEGVPFVTLAVGNYQKKELHDVCNNIWIQTESAAAHNVWYELGTPAPEYERYYKPFVWLANFSKHFIDYVHEKESVVLNDFKHDFAKWIKFHHSGSESFQSWYDEYGRDDFRQAVTAHRNWLWNQVYKCSPRMTCHRIWYQVLQLTAVEKVKAADGGQTVVTPYVHSCFQHMFGDKLKVVEPINQDLVKQGTPVLMEGVVIPKPVRAERDKAGFIRRPKSPLSVKAGQVVAIRRGSESEWESQSVTWFAYVQRTRKLDRPWPKNVVLDVIWIYAPEDTILAKERYPHHNELFFSDHCGCTEPNLYMSEVINVVSVAFMKGPRESECEFFIRQKYHSEDPAFSTLKEEDLESCECLRQPRDPYKETKNNFEPGDTVLVAAARDGKDVLEPVEIVRFVDERQELEVRVLERRHRVDRSQKYRPNELLWTNAVASIKANYVYRRCYARFISSADVIKGKIPAPYDRNGTGDCFFLSAFMDENESIKPFTFETFPSSFRQRLDFKLQPSPDKPIIGGMDLFCGGGSFGRGIEDGGVVEMKWAVDIDGPAMASYAANLREENQDAALYLGSINTYLNDAIQGNYSRMIADPSQVGFISAGSPCQGFSNANQNRNSEKSLRNCSLVASVATAIDVYRPLYGLLENVTGIATTRKVADGREFNVFSQMLCCIVGMGYQCQQFTLDAWSFGSPQSRTRLFLSIAAPGKILPPRPPRSHEHPPKLSERALFKAPNGHQFGGREMNNPCPFPIVSFNQGVSDLPYLGNNHVGICIPFPDHRNSRVEGPETRTLISHVPKYGLERSWRLALNSGKMPKQFELKNCHEAKKRPFCRSWSRLLGDTLCRTVTTSITPQCAFTGAWIHPMEDRLITVMEARRAQSFPDDEVLIGNPAQTFKIVGNSVARSVAFAWGLAIRHAYLEETPILRRR